MFPRLATLGLILAVPAAFPATGLAAPAAASDSCTDADAVTSRISLRKERAAIVCLMNVERAQRGIGPFARSRTLARAASGHSRAMVRGSYFGHQRPGGPSFIDRVKRAGYMSGHSSWAVGENLAWGAGTRSTARAIVRSWMLSGDHRDNVLDRSFDQVGIGTARGTPMSGGGYSSGNGLSNSVVVTADFGARS